MGKKILVGYASKFGSTREVAEKIASLLTDEGLEVDLRQARGVKSTESYDAVVIGTAIRMGKPLNEAIKFLKAFNSDLNSKPVAVFSVGLYMKDSTESSLKKARECIEPVRRYVEKPVSIGMFGGKIDYEKMPVLLRMVFSRDKSGNLNEGDWRDWESIDKWTRSVIPMLTSD